MLINVLKRLLGDNTKVQAFMSLLEITNCFLPEQKFDNELEALEWLKETTQKQWLRKTGIERWQIEDLRNHVDTEQFKLLFKKLGLLEKIEPQSSEYLHIVILGGVYQRAQGRMIYLKELFDEYNIIYKGIVLLGSKRQLDDTQEKDAIEAQCITEFDMMGYVFKAIFGDSSGIPLVKFNAENVKKADGGETRATTDHTIDMYRDYLRTLSDLENKKILVVSSNPYIPYQHAVTYSKLKELGVTVETVGPVDLEATIPVTLDALARMVFANYDRIKEELNGKCSQINIPT